MRRFIPVLFTLFAAAALWSCHKDPGVDTPGKTDPVKLSAENQWIYDQLCKYYYWNDAVKSATPKSGLEYDVFLDKLLTNLKGAQDDTENPATIDGYYYYDQYNKKQHQIYSYIDRYEKMRSESESIAETFGFGFEAFYTDDTHKLFCFLITWTQPGGPAETAGLERGMWIYKYNGSSITYDEYETFFYHVYALDGAATMTLAEKDGTPHTVASEQMRITPILKTDVLTSPAEGKKVAYLAYNAFETGDNYEFDNDLRSAFAEFKTAGVQELVLDLRYNHGGYVSCCQLLTSMAANVTKNNIFAKLQYNKSTTGTNPEITYFIDGTERNPRVGESNRLKLDRVFVLATGESASASEMVISSLRGVDIEVVHIGDRTEGKNVGMDLKTKTIGNYDYEMWPITFKIKNAKNFCDYAGGFEPDYLIDEFRNRNEPRVYLLGDPEEELLKAALMIIDGDKDEVVVDDSRAAAKTRSEDAPQMIDNPLRINRGGAKVIRNEDGELVL